MHARKCRSLMLGSVEIGGEARVSIQSMTNTNPQDTPATLAQIGKLAAEGCDIIRVAIPDMKAAAALPAILAGTPIPVVADIHFDHHLALAAIEAGVHGLRINPGNICDTEKIGTIARAAGRKRTVVRVGVNSGSLEPRIRRKYGLTPEAMVKSALHYCDILETNGCHDLKVSIKASDVPTTVTANRLFAKETSYPLHIGVTEAGTRERGTIKSAVGIGALLLEGIGNTIRVSLTGPPIDEIRVAARILEATGHRHAHPEIVSCPTCGRTKINLAPIVNAVEDEILRLHAEGKAITLNKIAIMGCAVNGPGEARDADLGIAGADGSGVLFKHGNVVKSLTESELLPTLINEIRKHTV